jgi:hypothetical protein
MDTVTFNLVRSAAGDIDVQASLAEANRILAQKAMEEQEEFGMIAQAVERVWEQRPTAKVMSIDALTSFALSEINAEPDQYVELVERIKSYIRANTSLFHIAKGKGGGVVLISRLNQSELAKVQEQRARAASKHAA